MTRLARQSRDGRIIWNPSASTAAMLGIAWL